MINTLVSLVLPGLYFVYSPPLSLTVPTFQQHQLFVLDKSSKKDELDELH